MEFQVVKPLYFLTASLENGVDYFSLTHVEVLRESLDKWKEKIPQCEFSGTLYFNICYQHRRREESFYGIV